MSTQSAWSYSQHRKAFFLLNSHSIRRFANGWRYACLVLAILSACEVVTPTALATDLAEPVLQPARSRNGLQEYRSQYLIVFTNLPPDQAKPAIKRLERTLV